MSPRRCDTFKPIEEALTTHCVEGLKRNETSLSLAAIAAIVHDFAKKAESDLASVSSIFEIGKSLLQFKSAPHPRFTEDAIA